MLSILMSNVSPSRTIYGPNQVNKYLLACANYPDSHHATHARGLIRAFALLWNILYYPMILFMDSECPDLTSRMRRLIWACAVRICSTWRQVPSWRGLYTICGEMRTYQYLLKTTFSKVIYVTQVRIIWSTTHKTDLYAMCGQHRLIKAFVARL